MEMTVLLVVCTVCSNSISCLLALTRDSNVLVSSQIERSTITMIMNIH